MILISCFTSNDFTKAYLQKKSVTVFWGKTSDITPGTLNEICVLVNLFVLLVKGIVQYLTWTMPFDALNQS